MYYTKKLGRILPCVLYEIILSFSVFVVFFSVFTLAPSIIWTTSTDWSGGTFANTTNITGDLMLNNTVNSTIYSWFYNGWSYRRQIVVNGSTSLLNDYQINLSINSTGMGANFNWSSYGNDTRFTWLNTSSGLEQNISFWIETWNSSSATNGNASLWIKIPNITSSTVANTTLYMYYGNPSATSQSNENTTFRRVIRGVVASYPFEGNLLDTSGNGHTATGVGGITYSTGKFGQAGTFSGSQYATTADSADWDFGTGDFSIDLWINSSDNVASLRYVAAGANDGGTNNMWFFGRYTSSNSVNFGYGYQPGYTEWYNNSVVYNNNQWQHVAIVRDGTNLRVYWNGTASSVWSIGSAAVNGGSTGAIIGARYSANVGDIIEKWNGALDELHIYKGTVLTQADITDLTDRSYMGYVANNMNLVRSYASPEPNVLSVGGQQNASSRGTYLSNTTTAAGTITSITALINKTEANYNGAVNLTNLTVDVSANGGSSWCGNIANNTAYTSANGCGGIGSGTQLVYRVNFSTNDTNRTAVLSDITLNYLGIVNLTCDAGGPYLANSSVMVYGNVSDGISALTSQPVTVQIKNNSVVLNTTVVTSDASGNWFAKLFTNTTNASSVFVNSTYSGSSGNCTYSLSVQSQTVIGTNATCSTNSTACAFRNYPISGWVMDSATGSLIQSGTVTATVQETGDSYPASFSGGYFSISPQFCLSPGKAYRFTIAISGNGKSGFIFTNIVGKG